MPFSHISHWYDLDNGVVYEGISRENNREDTVAPIDNVYVHGNASIWPSAARARVFHCPHVVNHK